LVFILIRLSRLWVGIVKVRWYVGWNLVNTCIKPKLGPLLGVILLLTLLKVILLLHLGQIWNKIAVILVLLAADRLKLRV